MSAGIKPYIMHSDANITFCVLTKLTKGSIDNPIFTKGTIQL